MFSKFFYLGFLKVQHLGHFYATYLLTIYISEISLGIKNRLNFADDSTISAAENIVEELISTLEQDSQTAIDRFKINEMIVNLDKFQALVVKKNCRMKDSYALNINKQTINSKNCVKLLGIEIDNTLSFDKHF